MTNEEIVLQIKQGHTELYFELWERVKKLMYKILYTKTHNLNLPNYITQEDLTQELYFALCNAVNFYSEQKPYKFNSYLEYPIMNQLNGVLRGYGKIQEYSYNRAIKEDEETELIDLIPDNTSQNFINDVELTDIQTIVREAVAELPEREKYVINEFYLRNRTLTQIAENLHISTERASQLKKAGLRLLSKNKMLKIFNQEFEYHYSHTESLYSIAVLYWNFSSERHTLLNEIETRRNNGAYISYGEEQKILLLAKDKYIKSYMQLQRPYTASCRKLNSINNWTNSEKSPRTLQI